VGGWRVHMPGCDTRPAEETEQLPKLKIDSCACAAVGRARRAKQWGDSPSSTRQGLQRSIALKPLFLMPAWPVSGGQFRANAEPTGGTKPKAHRSFQARLQARLRGHCSKRLGSSYRSGRSPHWLKVKNPAAPGGTREAEKDWGYKRRSRWR